MRRALALMIGAALLALAGGCGSDDDSGLPDDRSIFLVYKKSGGVAGLDELLSCHRDGQCELTERGPVGQPPVHGEAFFSEDDLDRLRETFDEAGFEDLRSDYPAPQPGSDYFSYEIAYEGELVTTETTGEPEALKPVLAELDALVTQVRAGDFEGE